MREEIQACYTPMGYDIIPASNSGNAFRDIPRVGLTSESSGRKAYKARSQLLFPSHSASVHLAPTGSDLHRLASLEHDKRSVEGLFAVTPTFHEFSPQRRKTRAPADR